MRFLQFLLFGMLLALSGCANFPDLAWYKTPCDYLQGAIEKHANTTELERVSFQRTMTLEEVITCIGEPDWAVGQAGGAWGWWYNVEFWYSEQGVAIMGRTDNSVADLYDENGEPAWVVEEPLFENPEDVIPAQLPVTGLKFVPRHLEMEAFRDIVIPNSDIDWKQEYRATVRPWENWAAVEIHDPLQILAND